MTAHHRAVVAYQKRHAKKGLCITCPRKAKRGRQCARCYDEGRRYDVEYRRRKRAGVRPCPRCKELGHYTKNCSRRR